MNVFPQSSHRKGLSPVWVSRCRFRSCWRLRTCRKRTGVAGKPDIASNRRSATAEDIERVRGRITFEQPEACGGVTENRGNCCCRLPAGIRGTDRALFGTRFESLCHCLLVVLRDKTSTGKDCGGHEYTYSIVGLASSRLDASGSISRARPSDCILFPVRSACIS